MNIPGAQPSDGGGKRLMILLVGRAFCGKSTAAATFPKPVFFDFDHKCPTADQLSAIHNRPFDPIPMVPFWDAEFCDKLAPRKNPNHVPNRKDAFINYLKHYVVTPDADKRISYDHTLVVDSTTALEEAIHRQVETEGIPISPKTGKPDGFYLWARKIDYLRDVFAILQAWPGVVIVNMHEQDEKNEEGNPTGRIRPLMSGSYADMLPSKFTCMFRQRVEGTGPTAKYLWDILPTRAFTSNNALNIKQSPIPATYWDLMKAAGVEA